MGDTIYDAPVCDVMLSTFSKSLGKDDVERVVAFNIGAVRRCEKMVGEAEAHQFLWLRLEGWDWNFMSALMDPIYDPILPAFVQPTIAEHNVASIRRYFILADTLKDLDPTFNVTLAKDKTVIYQPFMDLEEMTINGRTSYRIEETHPPYHPDGLIYDSQTETFVYG